MALALKDWGGCRLSRQPALNDLNLFVRLRGLRGKLARMPLRAL